MTKKNPFSDARWREPLPTSSFKGKETDPKKIAENKKLLDDFKKFMDDKRRNSK